MALQGKITLAAAATTAADDRITMAEFFYTHVLSL